MVYCYQCRRCMQVVDSEKTACYLFEGVFDNLLHLLYRQSEILLQASRRYLTSTYTVILIYFRRFFRFCMRYLIAFCFPLFRLKFCLRNLRIACKAVQLAIPLRELKTLKNRGNIYHLRTSYSRRPVKIYEFQPNLIWCDVIFNVGQEQWFSRGHWVGVHANRTVRGPGQIHQTALSGIKYILHIFLETRVPECPSPRPNWVPSNYGRSNYLRK